MPKARSSPGHQHERSPALSLPSGATVTNAWTHVSRHPPADGDALCGPSPPPHGPAADRGEDCSPPRVFEPPGLGILLAHVTLPPSPSLPLFPVRPVCVCFFFSFPTAVTSLPQLYTHSCPELSRARCLPSLGSYLWPLHANYRPAGGGEREYYPSTRGDPNRGLFWIRNANMTSSGYNLYYTDENP